MDTSKAVCAYSLWTIFCKHVTFFIAGKVWRCSVHVSRFIQSTSYSWRSDIWSKEKLHKENGQKICCYCGFENTDELGACRRYVVFINAPANRVFLLTWPTSMQIYRNKRKRLHKKRVQLPQDWFGTPAWPPFHCLGLQYGCRDVMWKHSMDLLLLFSSFFTLRTLC